MICLLLALANFVIPSATPTKAITEIASTKNAKAFPLIDSKQWCYDSTTASAKWGGVDFNIASDAFAFFYKNKNTFRCGKQKKCLKFVYESGDTVSFEALSQAMNERNSLWKKRNDCYGFFEPVFEIYNACDEVRASLDGIETWINTKNKAFINFEFTSDFFDKKNSFEKRISKISSKFNVKCNDAKLDSINSWGAKYTSTKFNEILMLLNELENSNRYEKSELLKRESKINSIRDGFYPNSIDDSFHSWVLSRRHLLDDGKPLQIDDFVDFPKFTNADGVCIMSSE